VDLAVQLDVGTELLIQRLAGRAEQEGRADDNPESVRNRLRVYTDQTAPVIDYYRGQDKLVCVFGVGSMEEVLQRVLEALKGHGAAQA
jgi:adenylate kinase